MEHKTFWKPVNQAKKAMETWAKAKEGKTEMESPLSPHLEPSRADRAKFPRKVIEELIIETGGLCQCGCGRLATSTHHVMPRGRNGRGVKKNAMRTNDICHTRIQTNEEELQYWFGEWERKFGTYFWFDVQDWEEYNRKQVAANEIEQGKQQRTEQLEPIVELLTVVTGRTLKAKELRLLDKLGVSDMAIFAKLISDVIGAGLVTATKPEFGYGNFDD